MKPSGVWTQYWWAKPGQDEPARKLSYHLGVPGTNYTVGAGVYDDKATAVLLIANVDVVTTGRQGNICLKPQRNIATSSRVGLQRTLSVGGVVATARVAESTTHQCNSVRLSSQTFDCHAIRTGARTGMDARAA